MYLALGDAARKTLLDRNPGLNAKTISLKQMIKEGESAFKVKRNRTMDRFLFLTRKQGEQETLEQFWNALNGLASICELQGLTKSLVHDVFIVNMRNTAVQERLCTEPRDDPEDALKFAIAFEQGVQAERTTLAKYCASKTNRYSQLQKTHQEAVIDAVQATLKWNTYKSARQRMSAATNANSWDTTQNSAKLENSKEQVDDTANNNVYKVYKMYRDNEAGTARQQKTKKTSRY